MALDRKIIHRILIVVLIAATLVRMIQFSGKQTLNHDEVISYLAATGHQGTYKQITTAQELPFGVWVKSSEWRRLLRPECLFCFGRIASDLAHFDIHPPLYFWLLHVWSFVLGVHTWTGPMINTLIDLGTALALFCLARKLLGEAREALLVTTLWSMSPTVITISSEARQYDLLCLITILFAIQVLRCTRVEHSGVRDYFMLVGVTTLGALTHYQFAVVVMGGVTFLFIKKFKTNRRHLVRLLASITVGYLIFIAFHPQFYLSLVRQNIQAQIFNYSEVPIKLVDVTIALMGFIMPISSMIVASSLIGFIVPGFVLSNVDVLISIYKLVSISMALALVWLTWATCSSSETHFPRVFLLSFLGWTAGSVILLFLTFFSPSHAMGPRYLSMAWPFLALLFGYTLRLRCLDKWRLRLMVLLCVGMCLIGITSVVAKSVLHRPDPSRIFTPGRVVLMDNVARGVLPRVYFHIPDDVDVFFANQDYILAHSELWLPRIQKGNAVYINNNSYGGSEEKKEIILALINQHNEVMPLSKGALEIGQVYLVK